MRNAAPLLSLALVSSCFWPASNPPVEERVATPAVDEATGPVAGAVSPLVHVGTPPCSAMSFAAQAQVFGAPNQPEPVRVADFNGDGLPDVAAGNWLAGRPSITIFLGAGDGGLVQAATIPTTLTPYALRIADMNGDGIPDVVFANQNSDGALPGSIGIALGHGDGGFEEPILSSLLWNPRDLVVGDFNGDGRLDVAVALASGQPGIALMLGNGDGLCNRPASTAERHALVPHRRRHEWRRQPRSGRHQLGLEGRFVWSRDAWSTVTVFPGRGDGTFGGAVDYPAGTDPGHLLIAT